MIKYELLIGVYYWVIDGANNPVRLKFVGFNHNETSALFTPHCGYCKEGFEIARKVSEVFRFEDEAAQYVSK